MRIVKALLIFVFLFCGFILILPTSEAQAQDTPKKPTLTLSISFRQDILRVNQSIPVSVIITNPSDEEVLNVDLSVSVASSISIYDEACETLLSSPILKLEKLAGNTVEKRVFCLKMNTDDAYAGKYNTLFILNYTWNDNPAVVTSEKTVEVDLIGDSKIVGVPLTLAGFFLPGMVLLAILKMFKIPIVEKLDANLNLVVAVVISSILVGPLSFWANKAATTAWLQIFNLNKQVNFQRIAAFILLGAVIGVIIGIIYLRSQSKKKIASNEQPYSLIEKSLNLNKDYSGKQVIFENKGDKIQTFGAHFVDNGTHYQILPEFCLIIDPDTDNGDLNALCQYYEKKFGVAKKVGISGKTILDLLSRLDKQTLKNIIISQPIERFDPAKNEFTELFDARLIELKKEDVNLSFGKDNSALLFDLITK